MKNQDAEFLTPQAHFECLLAKLAEPLKPLYAQMMNIREETAFRGRTFVVYEMFKRDQLQLDLLTVRDFECDDDVGASCLIYSNATGKEFEVSYTPTKVPGQDVFLFLPLHTKVRWCASEETVGNGSLAFPILIRTQSRKRVAATGRFDLREKGVTYCETGVEFAREFEGLTR